MNEALINLRASVAPVTVTDIVFAPVVVATRYHISADLVPVRVEDAFVTLPHSRWLR